MQTVITYLMLLITVTVLQAQNTIEVSMTQFKNDKGTVQIGLYNKAEDFLDRTYMAKSSVIKDKEASAVFTDVPDGVYAISVYHDADSNGKMNMVMGMIPSESYGCSNGAKGFFGPPRWADAKFEVKEGEVRKIDIKL